MREPRADEPAARPRPTLAGRGRAVIRRLDPLSRAAYGLLCIAGMALWAMPVLAAVGAIGGLVIALTGNGDRALAVWLGSWSAALLAALLFFAFAYTFWPLASDWIVEWQGYATALVIGGAGLALMAVMVFITDWPLFLEVLVPIVITFAVGFSIPGWFLGLATPSIRTLRRERAVRRR